MSDKNTTPSLERIAELEAQIEAIQLEAEEAKSAQMRALADLQNFQRREASAKIAWTNSAVSKFLQNVLPSFLELQLGSEHSEDDTIKAVIIKFFGELEKQGLQKIAPEAGETIDPNCHEVLLMAEGEPGCVVQCLEPGWQYQDHVIVPAKVSGAAE